MLKKNLKSICQDGKNGENSFDFYPIVKDYDMKKRILGIRKTK